MTQMIFVNLPVRTSNARAPSTRRSAARKEPKFSNEAAAMMVLSRHHSRHASDQAFL